MIFSIGLVLAFFGYIVSWVAHRMFLFRVSEIAVLAMFVGMLMILFSLCRLAWRYLP